MSWWRISLWVGLVALVVAFLWAVRGVLLPFVLAFVVAIVLEPIVTRMRRVGVPRPLTAVVFTVGAFGVLGGIIALTSPFVAAQAGGLAARVEMTYAELTTHGPEGPFAQVDRLIAQNAGLLEQFNLPTTRQGLVDKYVTPNQEQITATAQRFLTGGVVGLLSAGSQVFLLVLTPLFVFYLLMDMDLFRERIATWIPPSIRAGTLDTIAEISGIFKSYLRGLVTTILIYGSLMTLVMYLLGVKAFAVLGTVMGLFYLIPVLGGLFSSAIVFLVLLLSQQTGSVAGFALSEPWMYAAAVVGVLFVVGFAYDAVINPKIVGSAVALHPLVAVFVVFSASALFGLPGMLVAYPIAGAIKVTLEKLLRVSTSDEGSVRLPAVPLRHRAAEA